MSSRGYSKAVVVTFTDMDISELPVVVVSAYIKPIQDIVDLIGDASWSQQCIATDADGAPSWSCVMTLE